MICYEIVQNGVVMASVEADKPFQAKAEILHYAMQYLDEGDVTIREKKGRGRG